MNQTRVTRRRRARKVVMDVLYRMEIEKISAAEALATYKKELDQKNVYDFTCRLLEGVISHRKEIDKIIEDYADRWSLERMPLLDRNILRMGIYEILYEEDIPFSVSINEAVELANIYSTGESGKFINGILGRLVKELEAQKQVGST